MKYVLIGDVRRELSAGATTIITLSSLSNREILAITYLRLTRVPSSGRTGVSLMTYKEARPWAEAVKEEVLRGGCRLGAQSRASAIFATIRALTPEQLELIVSWADGGVRRGEEKESALAAETRRTGAGGPPTKYCSQRRSSP